MEVVGNKIKLELSTGSVVRTVLVLIGFYLLFLLRDVVLILLTSVVIASAIEPGAKWFERWHIRHLPAVIMIYLLAFAFFAGAVYLLAQPLVGELVDVVHVLPERLDTLQQVSQRFGPLTSWAGDLTTLSLSDVAAQLERAVSNLSGGVFQTATGIFGGALSFILILVFSFYLSVQRNGIDNFLRLISPSAEEAYILGLWRRSREKISRWVQGQLLLGVIMGVLVFLGLAILQIKYALTLGLSMIVFELIPIFGPVLGAVPAAIIGFNQSAVLGVMVIAWYTIIQQFENHLIYPLVVRKIIGVPPMIVIVALLVGVKLAGFLGLILAVPLATVLMEIFDDLEKRKKGQALPS